MGNSLQELKSLIDDAIAIYESNASWEVKYDLIFSDHISKRIGRIDYCDPDTSYQEDVEAYINALKEYKKALDGIQ